MPGERCGAVASGAGIAGWGRGGRVAVTVFYGYGFAGGILGDGGDHRGVDCSWGFEVCGLVVRRWVLWLAGSCFGGVGS